MKKSYTSRIYPRPAVPERRSFEQELTYIERVSGHKLRIKIGFVPNMRVPVEVMATSGLEGLLFDELKDSLDPNKCGGFTPALKQAANVASLPGIVKACIALPDAHSGYGFAIGNVAAFDMDDDKSIVSPGGVGFDINCGVRLIKTNLMKSDIDPVKEELATILFEHIPCGCGTKGLIPVSELELNDAMERGIDFAIEKDYAWEEDREVCEERGRMDGAQAKNISHRSKKRGMTQLGTLGAGNHYVEVQVVDEIYDQYAADILGVKRGQVCVMVHSGSRGFGHQIASEALSDMDRNLHDQKMKLNDRQLACVTIKSEEGQRYLSSMACACNYAFVNRSCLTFLIRKAFSKLFHESAQSLDMHLIYDVCHNIAKVEEHCVDGETKKLLVHRKGATRAFPPNHPSVPGKYKSIGQPALIGGTMGTCSYILCGTEKAMEETFGSTCHGAGRVRSRHKARLQASYSDVLSKLQEEGVTLRVTSPKAVAEEAPASYKDVSEVVEACVAAGISKKIIKLRPIVVIKG